MKTIILKVEVPDDAEMFSVSYRIPIEPAPPLGFTFQYYRDQNPVEIHLPAEEEIKKESLKYFEKDNDNDSLFRIGAKWAIKHITG
jgi:hypothetical protein